MRDTKFTISQTGHLVPIYGSPPELPGLYLALFHGRHSATEEMNGWGFYGPMIGPLAFFQTTYASVIHIRFESAEAEAAYFADPDYPEARYLALENDLIEYGGNYYGDWSAFNVGPEETWDRVTAPSRKPRIDVVSLR